MVQRSPFMSDSFLADLGRAIAAWSRVEHQFDLHFLSLVVMQGRPSGSLREPQVNLLMGLSFSRRIKIYRDTIGECELPEEKLKNVKQILDRLLKARKERDEIAHAQIDPIIDGTRILTDEARLLYISWKSQRGFQQKNLTQQYLKSFITRLETLYWDSVAHSLDMIGVKPLYSQTNNNA